MVASPPLCSYATLDLHILCDMHVPIWKLRGTVLGRGHQPKTAWWGKGYANMMHAHACFICPLYISRYCCTIFVRIYRNRCAYARVLLCITEVSGCSKTLLCGNPGFPMKQHVLLEKVWSMWALEAVWGRQEHPGQEHHDHETFSGWSMHFLHGSFLTVLDEDQAHYSVSCSCVRVWHPSLRGR